jgi:hypothetical protein
MQQRIQSKRNITGTVGLSVKDVANQLVTT